MVDTRRMMVAPGPEANPERDPRSLDMSFLELLNDALRLQSTSHAEEFGRHAELGIDYLAMPDRLSRPYHHLSWQSDDIARRTREASRWAGDFFEELRTALRANLHERYWWLFFLRSLLIDPRLDGALQSVSESATNILASLYLRGDPVYMEAEARANREFFDRHVRLVYGGGARNNAELFFPSCEGAQPRDCTWDRRPSYEQILDYRGGSNSQTTVLDALKANPGVGLIYVREENDRIHTDRAVPPTIHIGVMDRYSNAGRITVWRDEKTRRLVFRYRVDKESAQDPLGYGELGRGEGTVGTYHEWNDRSADPDRAHFYHNAVAGVGSYLYSNNPAIGDLLVFHSRDWNFGDNGSGHGGIHAGEKRTFILVSGPGVDSGSLVARARYRTLADGTVVESKDGFHYPTLLDLTPTALTWLGYPEDALERFAREGFAEYLRDWNRAQRGDILAQLGGVDDVERALEEAGFSELRIEQFRDRLARLLEFVALSGKFGEPLPRYRRIRTDGNVLILDQ
jgi:hypothetical protein